MNVNFNPSVEELPYQESKRTDIKENPITNIAVNSLSFRNLPKELIKEIFNYLKPNELICSAAYVEKTLAVAARFFTFQESLANGYWQHYFQLRFPDSYRTTYSSKDTDWLGIYYRQLLAQENIKKQNYSLISLNVLDTNIPNPDPDEVNGPAEDPDLEEDVSQDPYDTIFDYHEFYLFKDLLAIHDNEEKIQFFEVNPTSGGQPVFCIELRTADRIANIAMCKYLVAALTSLGEIHIWDLKETYTKVKTSGAQTVYRPQPKAILSDNGIENFINGEIQLYNDTLIYFNPRPEKFFFMPLNLPPENTPPLEVPFAGEEVTIATRVSDTIKINDSLLGVMHSLADDPVSSKMGSAFDIYDVKTRHLITSFKGRQNCNLNFYLNYPKRWFSWDNHLILIEENAIKYSFSIFDTETKELRSYPNLFVKTTDSINCFVYDNKIFIFEETTMAHVIDIKTLEELPHNFKHHTSLNEPYISDYHTYYPTLINGLIEFEDKFVDLKTEQIILKDKNKNLYFSGAPAFWVGPRLCYVRTERGRGFCNTVADF